MEFRILGPLEVEDEGQVLKLGGAKQRGLLTLLLLRANEAVSRDRLIDELWGDQPPETASTAIQVHISQLRKVLGRDVIVTQTPGYAVRLEAGQLDLARFEEAVAGARGAAPAEAADRLREALGLWRGVPLAGASTARSRRPSAAVSRSSGWLRSSSGSPPTSKPDGRRSSCPSWSGSSASTRFASSSAAS